ncbi:MAG TPA: hypothetical protein VGI39_21385, partial [Polyangiaceae bacterium]
FAFERAGGDAPSGAYALVVLNTNDFKASSTADGTSVLTASLAPNTELVDVLDANQTSYTLDGSSQLRITLPAQSLQSSQAGPGLPARILVPKSQVQATP